MAAAILDVEMQDEPDGILSDHCEEKGQSKQEGRKKLARKISERSSDDELNPGRIKKRNSINQAGQREKLQQGAALQIQEKVNSLPSTSKAGQPQEVQVGEPVQEESVKGRVLVVKPIRSEKDISSFIGKTIHVYNLLINSAFGKLGIEDIKTNFKRKSLTIIMKTKRDITSLCNLTKLGTFEVQVFQPTSHTLNFGVIYNIGTETTVEEINECLHQRQDQKQITAERIIKQRNGIQTPTTAVKLSFGAQSKPERVYLGCMSYGVHPYISKPMQCYNCQGFNHLARNCFSKPKCVVCAGAHSLKDCPKSRVCCSNCGGAHAASYAGCVRMKAAAEVEKLKVRANVTQREAVNLYKEQNKNRGNEQLPTAWNTPLNLGKEISSRNQAKKKVQQKWVVKPYQ